MALIPAKCTQCGSNIQVDSAKESGVCESCGTAFITEKIINSYNVTNNISVANATFNVSGADLENLLKKAQPKNDKDKNITLDIDSDYKATHREDFVTKERNTAKAENNDTKITDEPENRKRGVVIAAIVAVLVISFIAIGSGGGSNSSSSNQGNNYNQEDNYNQGASNNNGGNNSSAFEYTDNAVLFELPVACEDNVFSGATHSLHIEEDETDVKGYRHQNCYLICGSEYDTYIGYKLKGNYKTLTGTLYACNDGYHNIGWLDFYDGDKFLYSTEKISKSSCSTEFALDVSGVENLIIYFRAADAGTWMIAEDFTLSKSSKSGSIKNAPLELFNLPIYSENDFDFGLSATYSDIKGYTHNNKYNLDADNYAYVRYDLDKQYKTLSGTLYYDQGSGHLEEAWLEFYDGDTFLFSTEKLSDINYSTTFSFDISQVKYLTVYCKMADHSDSWSYYYANIIVDSLTISK